MIFISYRRDDARSEARLLYQELLKHVSESDIFMDVELRGGRNFKDAIRLSIMGSRVVLCLIGRRWMPTDSHCLVPQVDWVIYELELALALSKPILPILLGGASFPEPSELQPSLHPLTELNALPLTMGQDYAFQLSRILADVTTLSGSRVQRGRAMLRRERTTSTASEFHYQLCNATGIDADSLTTTISIANGVSTVWITGTGSTIKCHLCVLFKPGNIEVEIAILGENREPVRLPAVVERQFDRLWTGICRNSVCEISSPTVADYTPAPVDRSSLNAATQATSEIALTKAVRDAIAGSMILFASIDRELAASMSEIRNFLDNVTIAVKELGLEVSKMEHPWLAQRGQAILKVYLSSSPEGAMCLWTESGLFDCLFLSFVELAKVEGFSNRLRTLTTSFDLSAEQIGNHWVVRDLCGEPFVTGLASRSGFYSDRHHEKDRLRAVLLAGAACLRSDASH